ncbi:MAG: ParB N-terminal domain-containing protein, partial [Bryobacterales bacterium]|nr:ParB N-terminal domain-containing protein [Bryobacterales bacterium]
MDASVAAHSVLREEPRQTVLVALDSIDFGDRLRSVNQAAITHIAESIRRHGLQNPVQLRSLGNDRYGLIAGGHRCQAMRSLGQNKIEAFLLGHLDADQMALLEIDENLMRSEL